MTEQQDSPLATEEPKKLKTFVPLFHKDDIESQRLFLALSEAEEEEKDEEDEDEDEEEDEEEDFMLPI